MGSSYINFEYEMLTSYIFFIQKISAKGKPILAIYELKYLQPNSININHNTAEPIIKLAPAKGGKKVLSFSISQGQS